MTDEKRDTKAETGLAARIREAAEPACARVEAELVEVELRGREGSRVVKLIVDKVGGVDIDVIASVSRIIGDDLNDVVPGKFNLEVSSPGATRPLRTTRDFRTNIGRELRILRDEADEVVGELTEVTEDTIVLNVKGEPTTLALADINHGKIVLPW